MNRVAFLAAVCVTALTAPLSSQDTIPDKDGVKVLAQKQFSPFAALMSGDYEKAFETAMTIVDSLADRDVEGIPRAGPHGNRLAGIVRVCSIVSPVPDLFWRTDMVNDVYGTELNALYRIRKPSGEEISNCEVNGMTTAIAWPKGRDSAAY